MRKILLFSLMLTITAFASAQDVTGDWNGALKVGGTQLRLVFHISETDKGFAGTMDSPDQGAKDIPLTSVQVSGKQITIQLSSARIEYKGLIDTDSITGTFTQAGQSFPMNLTRTAIAKVETKRPQEPTKPYPYVSEEVTFQNPKAGISLSGTLTLPKKEGKFPAVVLVTGSGPQNRDEELMGHKPFLVLADYLTRNGIAVVRYDDRGCFASKGDFAKATTNDFATDAEAAVNYLKTLSNINPAKIGMIGHSEGGIIAPMAAVADKDIRFIVLMAGPGVSGAEILLLQQELIGRKSGMDEKKLQQATEINQGVFALINRSTDQNTLRNDLTNFLTEKFKDSPDMEIPKGMTSVELIQQRVEQITTPWLLNFIRYNPAPTLEKVKCPVLALIGEKDLQVPAKENIPAISAALKKGGNRKSTVKQLPGLNHLFQECTTGLPKEYAEIQQTMSPLAMETISAWIKQVVR